MLRLLRPSADSGLAMTYKSQSMNAAKRSGVIARSDSGKAI
jgi:hypothetical protein